MFSLLLLFAASLVFSLLLTPACGRLFTRWGIVDHPDGRRKLHAAAIPRVGGFSILLACAGAYGLLLAAPMEGGLLARAGLDFALGLLPAIFAVLITGLIDDWRGIRPASKICGQVAAGALAFAAGVRLDGVAGHSFGTVLSLALTIGWFVVCMNAFNLIDGLDGLAAGVGLCGTLTVLAAAWMQGNVPLAMAAMPLAGSLLGFLRFNTSPASVFLGDSGSLIIGFLLGCYGIVWSQKSVTLFGVTAPVLAMALPIGEMVLSTVRRTLRGQPVSQADRRHIHHRLLDQGMGPRRAAQVLYGVCAVLAALSLCMGFLQQRFAGLVVIVFCAAVWTGIRRLGYLEFQLAGKVFTEGAFQQLVDVRIEMRQVGEALSGADTWDRRVEILRRACQAFWFASFELVVEGREFRERCMEPRGRAYRIEVPLACGGTLYLERGLEERRRQLAVSEFVGMVAERLAAAPVRERVETPVPEPIPVAARS